MKLDQEERSLLHFCVAKVLTDEKELKYLSAYAKEQLLVLLNKLLK